MTMPILLALASTGTFGLLAVKVRRQSKPGWSARRDGDVVDWLLVRAVALTFASALIVVALSAGPAIALACGVASWVALRVLGVRRIK